MPQYILKLVCDALTAGFNHNKLGRFSQDLALGIELYGTAAHTFIYHKPPSKAITAIQLILKRTPKYFKPHQTELKHFINCIKQDKQPLTTGEDALKDLETIEQAYKNQIALQS